MTTGVRGTQTSLNTQCLTVLLLSLPVEPTFWRDSTQGQRTMLVARKTLVTTQVPVLLSPQVSTATSASSTSSKPFLLRAHQRPVNVTLSIISMPVTMVVLCLLLRPVKHVFSSTTFTATVPWPLTLATHASRLVMTPSPTLL